MIKLILKLLGFNPEFGKTNAVAGVINYAWLIPVMGWVWFHRAETIVFQVALNIKDKTEVITLFSTTYLGLSLVVIAIFGYIEVNRRAP